MAEVQARLAPGRPPDRPHRDVPAPRLRARRRRQHARPDLAGDAATHQADVPWTDHGDIACPLLSTERELVAGRRALGRHRHQLRAASTRTSAAPGSSAGARPRASRPSSTSGARSSTRSSRSRGPASTAADLTAAAIDGRAAATEPWMPHFYLGHGLGIDSAEMPYVGTDLGDGVRRDARPRRRHGARARADRVGRGAAAATAPRRCCVITEDGWEPHRLPLRPVLRRLR